MWIVESYLSDSVMIMIFIHLMISELNKLSILLILYVLVHLLFMICSNYLIPLSLFYNQKVVNRFYLIISILRKLIQVNIYYFSYSSFSYFPLFIYLIKFFSILIFTNTCWFIYLFIFSLELYRFKFSYFITEGWYYFYLIFLNFSVYKLKQSIRCTCPKKYVFRLLRRW